MIASTLVQHQALRPTLTVDVDSVVTRQYKLFVLRHRREPEYQHRRDTEPRGVSRAVRRIAVLCGIPGIIDIASRLHPQSHRIAASCRRYYPQAHTTANQAPC